MIKVTYNTAVMFYICKRDGMNAEQVSHILHRPVCDVIRIDQKFILTGMYKKVQANICLYQECRPLLNDNRTGRLERNKAGRCSTAEN